MLRKQTITDLEDPSCFHFKELWLSSDDSDEQKLLELFCFGTIGDVPEHMSISPLMWRKMTKLTLLGLATEARSLKYSYVMEQCRLRNGEEVEETFIALRGLIDFQIDSVESTIKILQCFDCRDVYGGERDLLLLHDVVPTKLTLIRDLLRWKDKLAREIYDNKYT